MSGPDGDGDAIGNVRRLPVHVPMDPQQRARDQVRVKLHGRELPAESETYGPVDSDRPVSSVRCSCGRWGPWSQGDPRVALAVTHGTTEPAGCASCGAISAQSAWSTDDPQWWPWNRYHLVNVADAGWSYRCWDRGQCNQRQAGALEVAATEPVDDPVVIADRPADSWTGNVLDVSADSLQLRGLTDLISRYLQVRPRCPRTWEEITPSPADRRTLVALVAIVSALETTANWSATHYLLAARKAGASWNELALAVEPDSRDSGEQFRTRWRADQFDSLDWFDYREEIQRLAEADGPDLPEG